MSAICFRTTEKGNLPHLSYIFHKPYPLRTQFKTVACYVSGDLLFIELQRGKQGINHSKYQQGIGATASCIKITLEATRGIGQKYRKGETNECFIFDSWFSSKSLEESAMEVGANLVGMVKTNTKVF